MSEEIFSQITLLITTYNRYPFLLRVLKFYEQYNFPFKILILDSSNDSLPEGELRILLEHERITYYRFDSKIFVAQKIASGLKNVTTPFSVLCADDDFIVPQAIEKCVDFLMKHADHSTCRGHSIVHRIVREDSGSLNFSWLPLYIQARSISDDRSLNRILSKISGSIFYAVYRTELLRLAWEGTAKVVSDWGWVEILPKILTLIYGKSQVLPIFYSSREANPFSWYGNDYIEKMYSKEKCEQVKKCIAEHLCKTTNISKDEAYDIIQKRIINGLIEMALERVKSKKGYLEKFFNRLKWHFRFKKSKKRYLRFFGAEYSEYYRDFIRIRKSVLDFNIKNEVSIRTRMTYQREQF